MNSIGIVDSETGKASSIMMERFENRGESADQSGSAIAEFILLAIPLFIPVLIFFLYFNKSAVAQIDSEMLARQVLAAFVTGEDDNHGYMRAKTVISEYQRKYSHYQLLNFEVTCASDPCLTPGSSVVVRIQGAISTESLKRNESSLMSVSSHELPKTLSIARGYVDRWRG